MIPRLSQVEPAQGRYLAFLETLGQQGFQGEIRSDYGTRLVQSTDNSIYQILPQAAVFPIHKSDLKILLELAAHEKYRDIRFAPRGGGTGTNGQSLTDGIIIDCSRHMHDIRELNLEQGWVKVGPGVVLDQLNDFLRPHGVFFAPNLSPSSRATLGGMINTDACGKGSRVYGRTSNHLVELSCFLSNGEELHSVPLNPKELTDRKEASGRAGQVYRVVDEIVCQQAEQIKEIFPKMSRFMTGYNLAGVYSNDQQSIFNLNYLLAGSEGTLALVHEAKLKLTPLPAFQELIVVKYESFDDALRAAGILVQSDPTAIETVDEKILGLAREDEIYHKVKDFVADEGSRPTRTINLVEFSGNEKSEVKAKVDQLAQIIYERKKISGEATGFYRTEIPEEIKDLWNLRKKGVGLLGNTKGRRKPIPFVEDTAVPPENLAAYIREFRDLLESFGLEYAMFGHVDVGCLHVRPALDLKTTEDEEIVRKISDGVCQLVRKYGGVMWAEHGRGFRTEYTEEHFGSELYQELRKIKQVFDPFNQLNPGKIVTPLESKEQTVSLEAPLRGHRDRQIHSNWQDEFAVTISCNGNGACFHYDPNHVMCPSSKITRDRIHSPKGRAGIMREWLRQLSLAGDPDEVRSSGGFAAKFLNSAKKAKEYDYSHEVFEAMSGCLACKACASQCPVHVDVPEFRSKFLHEYYGRYLRPLRDYLVGTTEWSGKILSKIPRLGNALLGNALSAKALEQLVGLIDAPALSTPNLASQLTKMKGLVTIEELRRLPTAQKQSSVILLQDAFTSFYEAPLVIHFVKLLQNLGFRVCVTPFRPNGKPLHIKGLLNWFDPLVRKNSEWLQTLATLGVPIVGIEPSMVLTYRDEYPKSLGFQQLPVEIMLPQEWLVQQIDQLRSNKILEPLRSYCLMGHCSEKTLALQSQQQWQNVFKALGLDLRLEATGCCGMAGTYGHEKEHYEESRGIFKMSWQHHMPNELAQQATILATGYSCRSQVKRFAGFHPMHPLQALLQEITENNSATNTKRTETVLGNA
ncbi:MAG: FAD-binding oxidoreductase [Deltaproteobacteria bacterium]|nr:FAD-binding oxidoreductase [Deltaproteobacteria bacterium]